MDKPDKGPGPNHSRLGTGIDHHSASGPRRRAWWFYLGIGLAAVAVIGLVLYSILGASLLPTSGPTNAAISGGPLGRAPGFSLPDQHGQMYTLTPGDGKNHLLVFYMGYF
jgi:cytochrome oxidase Cu insertion factor (SCO1/SenC/PrrC family)